MRHVRVHISLPTKAAPRSTPIHGDAIRFYVQLSRKTEEGCPSSVAANIRLLQRFAAFCLSKKAKNALSRRLLCLSAPSFCSFWGACRGDFQIPDLTFCLHAITLPLQVATFGGKCGHFRGRKWPRERQGLCGSIARLRIIPLGHAHGLAETALSLPRTQGEGRFYKLVFNVRQCFCLTWMSSRLSHRIFLVSFGHVARYAPS